jgi:hypothetical protein
MTEPAYWTIPDSRFAGLAAVDRNRPMEAVRLFLAGNAQPVLGVGQA